MPPFNPIEATIAALHRAYQDGSYSCVELTRFYLDRIARLQDACDLNAVASLNPHALAEARALDARRAKGEKPGPLHGVTVLLKDNINTTDMPTTNGSVFMQDLRPSYDAFVTQKLRAAGAIILGKAHMGEFAGGYYNTLCGVIRNPYSGKRSANGSSGGSGAAVSANLAMAAIGTDTSMSVRGPAAVSGIVGVRPTTGLVSRHGIVPKNLIFDTAGPMTRSVADAALLMEVLVGEDERDVRSAEAYRGLRATGASAGGYAGALAPGALKGKRLGVVENFLTGCDPEIVGLFEAAAVKLAALGAELVRLRLDEAHIERFVTSANTSIRRPADTRFREDYEDYLKTLGPEAPKSVQAFVDFYKRQASARLPVEKSVMGLLEYSLTVTSADPSMKVLMEETLPAATRFKAEVFAKERLDAMVFPSRTQFADSIAAPNETANDPTFRKSSHPAWSPTVFASYSSVGSPEIVVPMGFGLDGLPMTLSIMGKPYEEAKIIALAYDYEQATKLRKPPPL